MTPVKNKKGFFPEDFFSHKEQNQLRQVRTPLINRPHINSNLKVLQKNIIVAREKSKDKKKEKNNEKNNDILQNISFKINKSENINNNNKDNDTQNKNIQCKTPDKVINKNFDFENIFGNEVNNNFFENEEMRNDNLFKETPHFFPCIDDLKDNNDNYQINDNNKSNNKNNLFDNNDNNIYNFNSKQNNLHYKKNEIEKSKIIKEKKNENKNIYDINKKYKLNINNSNNKKTNSTRMKDKNEVVLPNLINENIVNKEIQNLFDNIPNQLKNDPDLKEKVGELLNNINEMKAFIETKKEQKFKLKRNKSGNKQEKLRLLNNKSENNLQNKQLDVKNKNKHKFSVQTSQNNLINKRPPISDRKLNLINNINSNNNINNNYNNNNNNHNNNIIQKQIPHPSKMSIISYDNNKIKKN